MFVYFIVFSTYLFITVSTEKHLVKLSYSGYDEKVRIFLLASFIYRATLQKPEQNMK